MPPKLVFQHQVISGGNGDQTGEYVPSEWTTHMCDRRDCNNHENLTKCSQCKSALYCSKECQNSLMFAAIVALDLYKRPENIDDLGLLASRFKLVSARTAPLSIMMAIMVAVMVIANNDGSLPGGLVSTEIRFKPVSIQQHLVRSPQLTDPTLDWYASLEYQVEHDRPNQGRVR
ncbi:hypothetical protein B0H14DRAFT_2997804 [Mycena olivaceomarginata]|nr:hypothetical protein B0H14DRAFT_2997804 [Mycena olivaceomarginata]